jgi:hypothetical protein
MQRPITSRRRLGPTSARQHRLAGKLVPHFAIVGSSLRGDRGFESISLHQRVCEHLAGQGLLGWGPHVTASRLDFGLLPGQRLIYFPNVASLR